MSALSTNFTHYHYDIRRATVTALRHMVSVVVTNPAELSESAQQLINTLMFSYITAMVEEDDKETVARICEAISSLFKQVIVIFKINYYS